MRGATSSFFPGLENYSQSVTLKIWSKTGSTFEEIFPVDRTTFADVKTLALRHFLTKFSSDHASTYPTSPFRSSFLQSFANRTSHNSNSNSYDIDNYKLISIESRRTIDEKKKLNEERVKDGDEYLLTTRIPPPKPPPPSDPSPIDERVIEQRTEELPRPTRLFSRDYRFSGRTEFRTDLNCILITLIETSQRLLWCHPDAENIFKQAEDILTRSSTEESPVTTHQSTERETRENLVMKLTDMGFTSRQAQIALKRTKNDLHAAMDFLLTHGESIGDEDEEENEPSEDRTDQDEPRTVDPTPFFSRNGPFISFRQYRQQRFQPNQRAIQSLKDMGFHHDDIVEALRKFHNDQNLACEYLLSDRQQQQTINDGNTEQGLDPNSSMFQSIMQNPIVQRTLNNPKTFFVMLKISENPNTIANYLNDPDIGNMLLQISRIYHAERDQMHNAMNHRHPSDYQERSSSRTTDSISGDFDNDSD